ncbi:hypothetical protein H6784_04570 [Candidatus Nomurabacteria bacterium]|nr:hypothetical protein [Candidatus Kaiserbacteria bacterium]MCB9814662.1 hypothetical protein [Candidatus Nomurabacteria bacterium]
MAIHFLPLAVGLMVLKINGFNYNVCSRLHAKSLNREEALKFFDAEIEKLQEALSGSVGHFAQIEIDRLQTLKQKIGLLEPSEPYTLNDYIVDMVQETGQSIVDAKDYIGRMLSGMKSHLHAVRKSVDEEFDRSSNKGHPEEETHL